MLEAGRSLALLLCFDDEGRMRAGCCDSMDASTAGRSFHGEVVGSVGLQVLYQWESEWGTEEILLVPASLTFWPWRLLY